LSFRQQKNISYRPHHITLENMSDSNYPFEINEVVMKKRILSVREHYDFQDPQGAPLASAEANFLQMPPVFVVTDTHGSELIRLQGKMVSIRSEFAIYDNQGVNLEPLRENSPG
jgi:uncharacterized protein YxjI